MMIVWVVCVWVGSGVVPSDVPSMDPGKVQRQGVVTIRNIGPNRTGDMKN